MTAIRCSSICYCIPMSVFTLLVFGRSQHEPSNHLVQQDGSHKLSAPYPYAPLRPSGHIGVLHCREGHRAMSCSHVQCLFTSCTRGCHSGTQASMRLPRKNKSCFQSPFGNALQYFGSFLYCGAPWPEPPAAVSMHNDTWVNFLLHIQHRPLAPWQQGCRQHPFCYLAW